MSGEEVVNAYCEPYDSTVYLDSNGEPITLSTLDRCIAEIEQITAELERMGDESECDAMEDRPTVCTRPHRR